MTRRKKPETLEELTAEMERSGKQLHYWEEQEKKDKFIALYWEAIHERLVGMFYTDIAEGCNDIHFKEDYEWDSFLEGVAALAEKWYDWI